MNTSLYPLFNNSFLGKNAIKNVIVKKNIYKTCFLKK